MNNKAHGKMMREKILKAIIEYIEVHQYPPTIREIGTMVGLSSTASVQSHLNKMIIEGTIETDDECSSSPRAIRVPGYRLMKENLK